MENVRLLSGDRGNSGIKERSMLVGGGIKEMIIQTVAAGRRARTQRCLGACAMGLWSGGTFSSTGVPTFWNHL